MISMKEVIASLEILSCKRLIYSIKSYMNYITSNNDKLDESYVEAFEVFGKLIDKLTSIEDELRSLIDEMKTFITFDNCKDIELLMSRKKDLLLKALNFRREYYSYKPNERFSMRTIENGIVN